MNYISVILSDTDITIKYLSEKAIIHLIPQIAITLIG